MATESLRIRIDETGARRVSRDIRGIGNSAQQAQRTTRRSGRVVRRELGQVGQSAKGAAGSVDLLRRTLGVLGGALVVRELGRMNDAFINTRNRIRTVAGAAEDLEATQDRLLRIANETRTSYETTVEVFARVGRAVEQYGFSARETEELVKGLNNAARLSGASADEARAALIQLSQGFASGELRGEEFRSVAEQMPIVLQVLQEEFGVTQGKLREMAFAGELTTDRLFPALLSGLAQVNEEAKELNGTFGRALVVLRNNTIDFIGSMGEATNISQVFTKGLEFVARNVDILGRAVLALSVTLGARLAFRALPAAIAATQRWTAALLANPATAVATAVVALTAAIAAFADKIALTNRGVATLADAFDVLGEKAARAVRLVIDSISRALRPLRIFFEDLLGNLPRDFGDALQVVLAFVGKAQQAFALFFSALKTTFLGIPALVVEQSTKLLNKLLAMIESAVEKAENFVREQLGDAAVALGVSPEALQGRDLSADVNIGRIPNPLEGEFERRANETTDKWDALLSDTLPEGIANAISAVDDFFLEVDRRARARSEKTAEKVRKDVERIRKAGESAKKAAGENRPFGVVPESDIRPPGDIPIHDPPTQIRETAQATQALAAQTSAVDAFFDRFDERAMSTADILDRVLSRSIDTAAEAITQFATTGKADIEAMVNAMIADLTRLAAQQFLLQLIAGAGSGGAASPAVMSAANVAALGGMQTGGSFRVGGTGGPDSQLVAFRASPNEVVHVNTPSQEARHQEREQQPPMVNVIQADDPAETAELMIGAMESGRGERTILATIQRNSEKVRRFLR